MLRDGGPRKGYLSHAYSQVGVFFAADVRERRRPHSSNTIATTWEQVRARGRLRLVLLTPVAKESPTYDAIKFLQEVVHPGIARAIEILHAAGAR